MPTPEYFALAGSTGLAASTPMYDFIRADLQQIDAVVPGIVDLPVRPAADPDTILMEFVDFATRDRAREGGVDAFNCLNELLDLEDAH